MSSSFPALSTKDPSRGEDLRQDTHATSTQHTVEAPSQRERDTELVKRARAGDQRAWGRLYQENFDRAYRYLLYLVGDADVAEDLTQETFARALVALDRFRGDASVQTWINRIAVNITREHWRNQKRAGRIREGLSRITDLGDGGEELHHTYVDEIRSRVLYSVLDELAPQLREAFILRDVMGHSTKDAADQLGISGGNLAVRAHRARRKVQNRLAELGWMDARQGGRS